MDAERITEIVDWALHQGVQPFIPECPVNSSTFQGRMLSNHFVSIDDSTLEAVVNPRKTGTVAEKVELRTRANMKKFRR